MAEQNKDPLLKSKGQGLYDVYIDRQEVGGKLLQGFLRQKANNRKNGLAFFADNTSVGVLSECYGLLNLCEISKFTDGDLGANLDAINKLNQSLNNILSSLEIDKKEDLVYRATPYANESVPVTCYTETVAVLLQICVEIRRMLYIDLDLGRNTIEIDRRFLSLTDEATLEAHTKSEIALVERLMMNAMATLVKSAIRANGSIGLDYSIRGSNVVLRDVYGRNMKYRGWNFTQIPLEDQDKAEISLYFTYVVTDAYLAFYEYFGNTIAKLREFRRHLNDIGVTEPIEKADMTKYGFIIPDFDDKKARDFEFVKTHYATFVGFNKTIVDAGHYIDQKTANIDTTKDFFNSNFNIVTEADIEDSSSNDALFNVLFALDIMMSAGVDLDYQAEGKLADFYDIIQYTVPNVQRVYKKLARNGKDYICDQYTLKFNEKLPSEIKENETAVTVFEQAKQLRKQHIVASNIIPLIIKSYYTVSKYMTPYPQYEMKVYKDMIVQNMNLEQWVFSRDGYYSIDNYNFVYALRSFYDYYETYERPFAIAEESYITKCTEEIEKIKRQHAIELGAQKSTFEAEKNHIVAQNAAQTENLLQETAKKVDELERELEAQRQKKAPVEEAIDVLIGKYLDKVLEGKIIDYLDGIAAENGLLSMPGSSVHLAFRRAFISLFAQECHEINSELERPENVTEEEFERKREEKLMRVIAEALRQRIVGGNY